MLPASRRSPVLPATSSLQYTRTSSEPQSTIFRSARTAPNKRLIRAGRRPRSIASDVVSLSSRDITLTSPSFPIAVDHLAPSASRSPRISYRPAVRGAAEPPNSAGAVEATASVPPSTSITIRHLGRGTHDSTAGMSRHRAFCRLRGRAKVGRRVSCCENRSVGNGFLIAADGKPPQPRQQQAPRLFRGGAPPSNEQCL